MTKDSYKGLIYLGEPSLREDIRVLCKRVLEKERKDIPVLYIEQPADMKKCWMSLYTQLLQGLESVDYEYVGICEHDCLYTYEHLSYVPPTDDKFYYNANHYLVQWGSNRPELEGQFTQWGGRVAMSQLVCNKKLLESVVKERVSLLKDDIELEGEFGVLVLKARKRAMSGKPYYLQHIDKFIFSQPTKDTFRTANPNVDIRHGTNFTGPKRGNRGTYTVPYWGKLEEIINGRVTN